MSLVYAYIATGRALDYRMRLSTFLSLLSSISSPAQLLFDLPVVLHRFLGVWSVYSDVRRRAEAVTAYRASYR